jgi:hypothetical protein
VLALEALLLSLISIDGTAKGLGGLLKREEGNGLSYYFLEILQNFER